jgi:PTH1 family peptidyl-tRNA hydrolase
MVETMKLIVGLGNPGKAYANNRHNIGFRCINHLAKAQGISLNQRQCRAQFGIGQVAGKEVALAKPRTFMNLSGRSVKLLMQRLQASSSDVLIVHDDLDLPLGKLRLYSGGGSGGHKGIESIIAEVESRDFSRIRVGIGRPQGDGDVTDHVLGDFRPEERVIIEDTIARVSEAILCLLREGMTAAMNKYN